MLEKIREGSQGPVAKTILVLVILSFAVAGVGNYLSGNNVAPAAEVNGVVISQAEVEQAYNNERARLESQLGEMFNQLAANPSYIASIRQGVLERLISKTLLDQAAAELGLSISDQQIIKAIRSMPEFQVDGQFNNDVYLATLRNAGLSPSRFRDMLESDLSRAQLIQAITNSEFTLESEVQEQAVLLSQSRDIRSVNVSSTDFTDQVQLSEEQIQTYYDQNLNLFNVEETVTLEYVELDLTSLAAKVELEQSEVEQYYQDNLSQYQTPEKRLAAHILINDSEGAELKAQDILAQIRLGADFAELAKTHSDDTFSAENGGQLDWFQAGVMSQEFDDALFALDKGAVSDVVKTDFGYQILKVLDIEAAGQSPLSEVKDSIENSLKRDAAQQEFFQLSEQLASISYEIPDSLETVSKELGLAIKTSPAFNRMAAPAPFNKADTLEIIFSDEVINSRFNSEPIEVGADKVMVLRVKSHQLAGTQPLTEVTEQVQQALTEEQSLALAKVKAEEIAQSIRDGQTVAELTETKTLGRFNATVDRGIAEEAFKLAIGQTSTARTADGYGVVVVDAINVGESLEAEMLSGFSQRLTQERTNALYLALIEHLKAQAEVTYAGQ
ncbi:SurA N-terminal domain-containing protein [Paraferrimonas sp. SM1919]|uniref:SurA N-terminal domain-containing protein n=1 Tax=Paraferrimonas sp. SM1919 TaxID=2662263 RepID=UPI0013D63825|nr:SurA N-terminal domain-containing protein [Paraferrimonas sp. SM1919]